jgi:hypothetical protein
MLERAQVLYLCVHGREGDPFLYGDRDVPVLTLDLVGATDLTGALVYMAGCWGAGQWSDAFLAAGAAAVVADSNEAWAGKFLPVGSQALGRLWLKHLRLGYCAGRALQMAKYGYAQGHDTGRDLEMLGTVALYGDPDAVVGMRNGG